jgi:hypothetical protein
MSGIGSIFGGAAGGGFGALLNVGLTAIGAAVSGGAVGAAGVASVSSALSDTARSLRTALGDLTLGVQRTGSAFGNLNSRLDGFGARLDRLGGLLDAASRPLAAIGGGGVSGLNMALTLDTTRRSASSQYGMDRF